MRRTRKRSCEETYTRLGVGAEMKEFRLEELEAQRAANDGAYLQFLRERHMSVGLYALDRGATDPQQPHKQDEVYLVVSGRGAITVGQETTAISPPGSRRRRIVSAGGVTWSNP